MGYNLDGQLGDGTTTDRSRPTLVRGLSNVRNMARGPSGYHMMATTMDNETYSWGRNRGGVLGLGNENNYSTPQRITGF